MFLPIDPSIKLVDADVLVVDDQEAVVAEFRSQLETEFGAVVTFVDSGQAAKHLRSGERYKVLLLDIAMEPVSGLALLKLARQLDPAVQVIMMTAQPKMSSVVKALQLGAVDYIHKPVSDWGALKRSVHRAAADYDIRVENERLTTVLKDRNEALRRAVELLRHINRSSEQMHNERDVKKILRLLLEGTCQLLQAHRVSVMIRDPKKGKMAIQVAQGLDASIVKNATVDAKAGVAGLVMETGQPLVVNAPEDWPPHRHGSSHGTYQARRFMCVPIVKAGKDGKEQVMGVVNVTERHDDRPFLDVEVEFVASLARQAALAVTGAALWQTIASLATVDDSSF